MNYVAIVALGLIAFGLVDRIYTRHRDKALAERLRAEAFEAGDRALDIACVWHKYRNVILKRQSNF